MQRRTPKKPVVNTSTQWVAGGHAPDRKLSRAEQASVQAYLRAARRRDGLEK